MEFVLRVLPERRVVKEWYGWEEGGKGSYDILIAGFVSFSRRRESISCFRYHDDSRGVAFSHNRGGRHELEVGQCYGVCGPKVSRLILLALDGVDLAVFSFVVFVFNDCLAEHPG